MRKPIIFLVLLLTHVFSDTVFSQTQQPTDKRISIIRTFLNDLYTKPLSGQALSEKYIYFQPLDDKNITLSQRMILVDTIATNVRQQTGQLYQANQA